MKYDVTLYGPTGIDVVTVEADSGDEAATRGWRPGCIVRGVTPSEDQTTEEPKRRGRPPVQAD